MNAYQTKDLINENKLLRDYAKNLEQRLTQTEARLQALSAAKIDEALQGPNTMPLLLREAQAAMRRSNAELEQQVAERTAALSESEMRYRLASQAVNGVLYDWDLITGEILPSPGMENLIGYVPDEVPGDPTWWRSLVEPEDRIVATRIFETALHSNVNSYQAAYRVRHKDGHWVHVSDQATILRDNQGQPIRLVGTATDITPQKRLMEALHNSDERFRVALAHAGIIVFSQDHELRYTWMYNRLPGYYDLDHIGKTDADLFLPEEAAKLTAIKRKVLETAKGALCEVQATIPGYTLSFDLIVEPLRSASGEIEGILGSAVDITERKHTEAALRESEERFRIMADGTPVVIWVTDAEGQMEFINRAYTNFFGVTLEQVQSGTWQALVHPENTAGYIDVYIKCLQEHRPFRAETRTRHSSGQWRWIESQGQPRFSDSGVFLGMVGSSLDINDRKQAEETVRQYAARLEQSNQDLEEFAFVASHDLKEPLLKVKSFANTLAERHSEALGEPGLDYLQRMQNAAERMQRMIDDLLYYSRVNNQGQAFQPVDLHQVVIEVLDVLEARIVQSHAQIEVGELPVLSADPAQMRQLFQNLLSNALKFRRTDTAPVVKVGLKPLPPDQVSIFVEDNGIGFASEDWEVIFQPFKRLHGIGQYPGSGIGLALCRKIVTRHGGAITAESQPGAGATFWITLPLHLEEEHSKIQ